MSRKARVTFSYKPEQDDELVLEVGDIITNITDVDVGWCEGELNGKKGMFPDNFVEEFSTPGEEVPSASPLPSSNSKTAVGKKAKVAFDYEAQDADELTLHMGDIVDFMEEVEEGWWKGKLHGKVGVFPSNFVEPLVEEDVTPNQDKPAQIQTEKEPPVSQGRTGAAAVEDDDTGINKRHSSTGKAKQLPGGGMGFGNLINANILAEKKLKKVHPDEKKEKKDKFEERNVSAEPSKTVAAAKAPLGAKSRPAPPVPSAPPIVQPAKKPNECARVMFDYEPENLDELKLTVGDIVNVMNQNIPDTEGWWEGELNGMVGVFPCNFVELLPAGVGEVSSKAPAPPQTHKKGVPVLPMRDELKKSPKLSRKHSPPVSPKEESDAKVIPDVQKTVKDANSEPFAPAPTKPKPPVAGQKPVLPPKKPLPIHKKPAVKGVPKKPEKKAETGNTSVVEKKRNEETDDIVDDISAEKVPSQEEGISKPTEIQLESTAGSSLDDIPATETLNHLTANRAKNPQKRPPSKEGRTDPARLSGDLLEEQIAEANKQQPPERPKEPPREPAWKKEVREAREKKQTVAEEKPPPLLSSKTEALEKRKSLREEVPVPLVQKVEPFATAPGEVAKLRKEIGDLREMIANMDKKHNDALKRLEEKFTREIEGLITDFDEERKHSAALKVELDRIKRRQNRQDSGTTA